MIYIFVPSLGRPGTAQLLNYAHNVPDDERDFYQLVAFIEPHEAKRYRRTYPTLQFEVLPKRDQGLMYVRNYIKSYAEAEMIDYFWMLDDDLTGITEAPHKAANKIGFTALRGAQELLIKAGVALGALEYGQYAWSATKPLVFNSYCDCCVFFNVEKMLPFKYRPEVIGKSDRDLVMQTLAAGHKVARTTGFAFTAPANGSNKGGLRDTLYAGDTEEKAVLKLVEMWPGVCEAITKPSGRKDLKIHWKKITPRIKEGRQGSIF